MDSSHTARDRGNRAFAAGHFEEAVESYTEALRESPDDASLLCNRSAALWKLQRASAALADADRALALAADWPRALARRAFALQSLGRSAEAAAAFDRTLERLPADSPERPELQRSAEAARQAAEAQAAAAADSAQSAGGSDERRLQADELECALCMRVFFEPLTLFCGHSFCRACVMRALDHDPKCPLCRVPVHLSSPPPVSIVLAALVQRHFAAEYAERRRESEAEERTTRGCVALFVLPTVAFPQCELGLHVFEPRYRLMVRRALAADRRFAIVAAATTSDGACRPAEVATLVQIDECASLADGRFLLQTRGLQRLRVLNYWELDGYLMARAEPLEERQPTDEAEVRRALQTAALLAERAGQLRARAAAAAITKPLAERLSALPPAGPALAQADAFAYALADALPADLATKQRLLECESTAARLQALDQLTDSSAPARCLLQ